MTVQMKRHEGALLVVTLLLCCVGCWNANLAIPAIQPGDRVRVIKYRNGMKISDVTLSQEDPRRASIVRYVEGLNLQSFSFDFVCYSPQTLIYIGDEKILLHLRERQIVLNVMNKQAGGWQPFSRGIKYGEDVPDP